MATMYEFNDGNFQAEVVEASRRQPVLVEFTAEWCGPCHMLAPIIDKLNDEWNGAVRVGRVDMDFSVETCMAYSVMSVPVLILFKNGQIVERLMGFNPRERILAKLKPHLS
jgi:thioredoxin 1